MELRLLMNTNDLYGSGATRIGWGLWTDKTESTLQYTFDEYAKAEQAIL